MVPLCACLARGWSSASDAQASLVTGWRPAMFVHQCRCGMWDLVDPAAVIADHAGEYQFTTETYNRDGDVGEQWRVLRARG